MIHLNRNHFFLVGLVILLLGVQFRFVDSFEMNEQATKFLDKRFRKTQTASAEVIPLFLAKAAPTPARVSIEPPDWLGWAMLSVGSVLVLHSLAMRKPE